jgi:hypothetical protein
VAGTSALGLDYVLQKPANLTTTSTISTLDQTPPTIGDFQWLQDASKMHDGTIKFSVSDNSGVASARLNLVPVFPSEIPAAAIPAEDWIDFPSATSNVTLPTKSVQFSQAVADLKGGKTYTTNIIADDTAGNQAIRSYDIPYVREFENVAAGLDPLIASTYLFFDACTYPTDRKPLLGCHYHYDQFNIAKQIDWASGHGVSVFFVSWDHPSLILNIPTLISHPLATQMRFVILYDTVNRLRSQNGSADFDTYYAENRMTLTNDFDSFCNTLFPLTQFHVIDNKPMVYFYNIANALGDETKVADVFVSLRQHVKQTYGFDVYFVSDHIQSWASPTSASWVRKAAPFDGVTAWGGDFYGKKSDIKASTYEEHLDKLYETWTNWANRNGKGLIPSFKPSENTTQVPWGDHSNYVLPRSPELFERRLEIMFKYMDPKLKMIRIDTWNDWYENTEIEPSLEDGLAYLNILRDRVIHT